MSDDRLNRLKRAWEASRAVEDEVAYLRERVRVGELRVYPAVYTDTHGVEETWLYNDGTELAMIVRGVRFSGPSFDDLEPDDDSGIGGQGFTLEGGALTACVVECELPLPVVTRNGTEPGQLHVRLELPGFASTTAAESVQLSLRLQLGSRAYSSAVTGGGFEDELLSLQAQLPGESYLKACVSCAFSDYSPYGTPLFGDMICYRDSKEAYARVTDKESWFEFQGPTHTVQETWLCPEFERRSPGTGYRG